MSRVFFFSLFLFSLFGVTDSHAQLAGYRALDPEPFSLTFKDDEGKDLSTDTYDAAILVINFWAPNCAPCVKEMPSLRNLQRTFDPKELTVLTICISDLFKEQARSLFHLQDFDPLPLLYTDQKILQEKLSVRGIPVTIVVNQKRQLIGRLDGATEWDHFEVVQFLDDLVKGKSSQASEPKAWYEKLMEMVKALPQKIKGIFGAS